MTGRKSAAQVYPDLAAIRDILTWITQAAERERREGRTPSTAVDRKIETDFPLFGGDAVEASFTNLSFNSLAVGRFIRLPQLPRGLRLTPVLAFNFDWTGTPSIAFRVGIFGEHGGEAVAIGMRFESPAGGHNYWHMQFIREFGRGVFPLPTAQWIPDAEPTFPISARTPVQLLLALLLSLYGESRLKDLKTDVPRVGKLVDEFIHELRR